VALAPVEPGTHTALRTRARGEGLSLADLALRALVGIAVAALVFLALLPHTGLYRTETVLSNSMKPHFGAGDLLVVTPEPVRDVRVGQVISIHVPNGDHHVQTHRIVQVVRGGEHPVVRTKGDANDARDQFTARLDGKTAWRVRFVVPKLGWAIVWLRNPLLWLLTVFLAPAAFVLLALRRIWTDPDDGDAEEVPVAPPGIAPLT
jgi:signal peptidase I